MVEYVYGNPDWFPHEETPLHVDLSQFIARQLVEDNIPITLVKNFPSLRVNMVSRMMIMLRLCNSEMEEFSQKIDDCATYITHVIIGCKSGICHFHQTVSGKDFFEAGHPVKCGCGSTIDYAFQKKSP